jgi:hypothetical protein
MTDELRKLIAEEKARDVARKSAEERSRAKQQALEEKRLQIESKWRMDTETGGWAQAISDINAELAEVDVELQAHGQYPQTSPLVSQLIVTVDKKARQVGTLVCDLHENGQLTIRDLKTPPAGNTAAGLGVRLGVEPVIAEVDMLKATSENYKQAIVPVLREMLASLDAYRELFSRWYVSKVIGGSKE